MSRLALAVGCCTALSIGCASTNGLTVTPINRDKPGVVVSMPKTVLRVTILYQVDHTVELQNGFPVNHAAEVSVVKPITVQTVLVADPTATFQISPYQVADGSFLDSKLGFAFDDGGLLQSVDSEISDKTIQAIQSYVSAGISVAKIVAAAGTGIPLELQGTISRMRTLYTEFGRTTDDKSRKNLKAELDTLQDVVDAYVKKNAITTTTREVTYTLDVDIEQFAWKDQTVSQGSDGTFTIQPDSLIAGVTKNQMPLVTLTLHSPWCETVRTQRQDAWKALLDPTTSDKANKDKKVKGGFPYRLPAPLKMDITSGTTQVLSTFVPIAQFGETGMVRVDSKRLGDRKTQLSFGGNGGIKQYKIDSSSTADKLAASIATSLDSLQKSLNDIRYGVQTDALAAQRKLADAQAGVAPKDPTETEIDKLLLEKKLVEAQVALEKAKQDLAELKKKGGG
jgi:hypothetical protein